MIVFDVHREEELLRNGRSSLERPLPTEAWGPSVDALRTAWWSEVDHDDFHTALEPPAMRQMLGGRRQRS